MLEFPYLLSTEVYFVNILLEHSCSKTLISTAKYWEVFAKTFSSWPWTNIQCRRKCFIQNAAWNLTLSSCLWGRKGFLRPQNHSFAYRIFSETSIIEMKKASEVLSLWGRTHLQSASKLLQMYGEKTKPIHLQLGESCADFLGTGNTCTFTSRSAPISERSADFIDLITEEILEGEKTEPLDGTPLFKE